MASSHTGCAMLSVAAHTPMWASVYAVVSVSLALCRLDPHLWVEPRRGHGHREEADRRTTVNVKTGRSVIGRAPRRGLIWEPSTALSASERGARMLGCV